MKKRIDIVDKKKGNLIYSVICYDKKTFNVMYKQLKKQKQCNIIVEE